MPRKPLDEEIEVLPELKLPPIPRWGDIVGQDRAIQVLQTALASGRVHHAWLFSGPQGVGKFTTALAFAASLMDETAAANLAGIIEPDPDSPTQKRLRAGAHPDLHIVRKELAIYSTLKPEIRTSRLASIPIDVVREFLIQPATRAPTFASRALAPKVFIVDEAELLGNSSKASAQNALLKTLEEPPPGTVLILVATSEDRLLPTIRSRCQRIAFRALSDDEMDAWIRQRDLRFPPASRRWLLQLAQGAPGRLIEALDAGLADWELALAPVFNAIDKGLPVIDLGPIAAALIDEYAKSWTAAGENRSKDAANRMAARRLLSVIAEHFRTRMRTDADSDRWSRAVFRCERAARELATHVQAALVFDALAADLGSPAGSTYA